MRTVAEIIAELSKLPADALVYAYEGEDVGIVIVVRDKDGRQKEIGFVPTPR